jgi:hypothetical protein
MLKLLGWINKLGRADNNYQAIIVPNARMLTQSVLNHLIGTDAFFDSSARHGLTRHSGDVFCHLECQHLTCHFDKNDKARKSNAFTGFG